MKDIDGSSSETERPILPKNAIHKNLLQDIFSFSRASPTLRYGLKVNNDANFSFFSRHCHTDRPKLPKKSIS